MARDWRLLIVALVLGAAAIALTGSGKAADDDKDLKVAREKTLKIADLVGEGKDEEARKQAAAFAKKLDGWKDVGNAMKTMALRDQGGVGFGPAGKFKPDGIEAKFINLGRRPLSAKQMNEESETLVRSANIAIACADIALSKPPAKRMGKKDPDDWKNWAKEMRAAAKEVSVVAAKKDPEALKKSAERLNTSCTDCHAVFKEK